MPMIGIHTNMRQRPLSHSNGIIITITSAMTYKIGTLSQGLDLYIQSSKINNCIETDTTATT